MKLLDQLRVAGWDLPVVPDKKHNRFGAFRNYPSPHIKCHPSLCKKMMALTLLHEGIHAISDMHGLDLSEFQVRTLEIHIGALMRDNPKLAKALMNPE